MGLFCVPIMSVFVSLLFFFAVQPRSQGSVLVDYFVELNDLKEKVSTQQLKLIFHEALRNVSPDVDPLNATSKGPMKLGKFIIDPKSTDFVGELIFFLLVLSIHR